MEPVDRRDEHLQVLVRDLDTKLGRWASDPVIIPDPIKAKRRPTFLLGLPVWLGLVAITFVFVGAAAMVVQPWEARCSYSAELCRITRLDIDAVRMTVPNSDLMAALPNIDALDPDDVLTVGEILDMERYADLDLTRLLTPDEIDLLLDYIE